MDPLAPLFLWYGMAAFVLAVLLVQAVRAALLRRKCRTMHRRLMRSDPKYQLLVHRQATTSAGTAATYRAAASVYLLDRLLEECALTGEQHRTATLRAWAAAAKGEPPRRA